MTTSQFHSFFKKILHFLQLTNRYLCSSEGEVFCQTGWEEPSDPNLKDPLNPCPIPVCELNGQPCEHGDCKAPNYCTCEVGWEGPICDICIPLPGTLIQS